MERGPRYSIAFHYIEFVLGLELQLTNPETAYRQTFSNDKNAVVIADCNRLRIARHWATTRDES